jgi:hypothetical protein
LAKGVLPVPNGSVAFGIVIHHDGKREKFSAPTLDNTRDRCDAIDTPCLSAQASEGLCAVHATAQGSIAPGNRQRREKFR